MLQEPSTEETLAKAMEGHSTPSPEPPPLPTQRVDYMAMPWHTLRSAVGDITGTKPKNKAEAVAALKHLDLL